MLVDRTEVMSSIAPRDVQTLTPGVAIVTAPSPKWVLWPETAQSPPTSGCQVRLGFWKQVIHAPHCTCGRRLGSSLRWRSALELPLPYDAW